MKLLLIANKLLNAGANLSITNNDDKSVLQIGRKYFNYALEFHFDHIKYLIFVLARKFGYKIIDKQFVKVK